MKRIIVLLFILSLVLSAGCTTPQSKLVDVYKNPEYKAGPIKSCLVIGVAAKPKMRQAFEILFSKELKSAGLRSLTSFGAFPDTKKLETKAIQAAAMRAKIQAVIVVSPSGVERKTQVATDFRPETTYHSLHSYFPGVHGNLYGTSYAKTRHMVQLECNIYDAKTANLVWTGHSEIGDPKSVNQLANDLAGLMVRELKKEGLIQ